VTLPAVASNITTYASHSPYITVAEWQAAPTAIDTSDLILGGSPDQQTQAVADAIERVLASHTLRQHLREGAIASRETFPEMAKTTERLAAICEALAATARLNADRDSAAETCS